MLTNTNQIHTGSNPVLTTNLRLPFFEIKATEIMETLITFGLGAGTVLIIVGVVVVSKLVKQVKALKQTTVNIGNTMTQEVQHLHHRIDDTERTLNSTIDSRVDKLDAKFCSDGKALTEKSIEFLKL